MPEKLLEVRNWNIQDDDKDLLPVFVRDYELGKITGRRGNNPESNILRNLYHLKVGLENLKKQEKVFIEVFLESLLKNEIRTFNQKTSQYDGSPYAMRSKQALLKNLSAYFKWKYKELSYPLCEVLNIELSAKTSDIEIYSDSEFDKWYSETSKLERRFLLRLLNAMGPRAEEFHNIRSSDLVFPTGKEIYLKVQLRSQFSKTKGRTVSVYDKKLVPIAKQFIADRLLAGMKPEDPVYVLGYDGNRKWMSRVSKLILGKSINYHMFRHTAATRLASRMNRQQLCVYFGWDFNSSMPDIYIQRAGVDMDSVTESHSTTDYEELESQNKELFIRIDSLENKLDSVLSRLEAL